MRGLIIGEPWIDLILDGKKTWEMRSTTTRIRGPVALIRAKSNSVAGMADLVDSLPPISRQNYMDFADKHAIPASALETALGGNWVYPWVLTNIQKFDKPVPFQPKSGPVIFTMLDATGAAAVAQQASADRFHLSDDGADSANAEQLPLRAARTGLTQKVQEERTLDLAEAIFVFRAGEAQAYGRPADGREFVVLEGSTAMRHGSPNKKRDLPERDSLVRQGVLVEDANPRLYRFAREYRFSSASKAGGIVKDGNTSGPQSWRDERSGKTLKDYFN